MATYKESVGTAVTNVAGDFPGAADGELWFNSTDSTFQYQYGATTSAWSTGGNLNNARFGIGGAGTQTAALGFAGYPPNSGEAFTELYNGSTWTEVNDMVRGSSTYDIAAAGTQTSALGFGGGAAPQRTLTESWNGTNWTSVNALNVGRNNIGGFGTDSTAAIAAGGTTPAGSATAAVESWNGTNWTEVNDLSSATRGMGVSGKTQTAGLIFGGSPPFTNKTESWNGTNWTELNDMNTTRDALAGAGTQTSALGFGGEDPSAATNAAESWNGTSWTTVSNLGTARYRLSGAGSDNTSALAFGGTPPVSSVGALTEEWNTGIPVGAWSTGGNLNTARSRLAGAGTQTAGLAFGGDTPPVSALTELYDGSAWTEVNDLNTARDFLAGAGNGTSTATLAFGGETGSYANQTESWNGSNWTEVNDLNSARAQLAGAGISTSALAFGGFSTPPVTFHADTELWNGTNWTEVNNLNAGRNRLSGTGANNTAALAIGGQPPTTAATELWNGTNWTEVNDLNIARQAAGVSGITTAALAFGGNTNDAPSPPTTNISAKTELWNGTSWSNQNNLNVSRLGLAGAGTTSSSLAFGGETNPDRSTATEEWNNPGTIIQTLTS